MYGLFTLDILSYGRIVTVDAALSQIVADRYCSDVFILMVSTPVKVIRRQVRRPARPFQIEYSNVSFLGVNPFHDGENTCAALPVELEGLASKDHCA